jgi:hypothetical protein
MRPEVASLPRGPYQGAEILGETTEAIQGWLKDGWVTDRPPPRIVEDLEFEPKDREEVVYVYMYRVARNSALLNAKGWRPSKVVIGDDPETARRFFERPPLYLDYYYLIAAHSKFRSDAERLLGWVLLRLNEATHLVYRPRRYILPDGTAVDSTGERWTPDNRSDGVVMEKVSVDIVDDLTIGDAVNFYNIHDAPFRPYVTYRARCAMEGSLIEGQPTTIRPGRAERIEEEAPPTAARANGRQPTSPRARLPRPKRRAPIGPEGSEPQRIEENEAED